MEVESKMPGNGLVDSLHFTDELESTRSSSTLKEPPLYSDPVPPRTRSSTTTSFINLIQNGSQSDLSLVSKPNGRMISLFRLLLIELNLPGPTSSKKRTEEEEEEERQAYEQLANMIKVPAYLEKFIVYGLLVCLNSLLTLFTLVPLKICIITYSTISQLVRLGTMDLNIVKRNLHFVKRDIITILVIFSTIYILCSPVFEISRLYHDIRGQAHIKLYVMFGVLEVADKLLSSIGLEIFTVLVGIPLTDTSPVNMLKLLIFLVLELIYSSCHSYALIYQCVSLHVAANSYSNALLALLLSNQFAELKGAVFKKFEKEGLFQVSMSDLTERFQLSIMLFIITLRNLSQLGSTQLGLIPDSWKSWNKWFGAIFGPSIVVLGSEIFVDWLKHCFIIKFNRIRPTVYDNFLYVLSLDFLEVFVSNSKEFTLREASDYIVLAKRIGLPITTIAICCLRMSLTDLKTVFLPASFTFASVFGSLALLSLTLVALLIMRLIISLWLLKWGRRIKKSYEARQLNLAKKSEKKLSPISQLPIDSVPGIYTPSSRISDSLYSDVLSPEEEFEDNLALVFIDLPKLDTNMHTSQYAALGALDARKRHTLESDDEIETSFIPGVPNTEMSSINPTTRNYLYDYGEKVPPTLEEKRNQQVKNRHLHSPVSSSSDNDSLSKVKRYEMASKRIW